MYARDAGNLHRQVEVCAGVALQHLASFDLIVDAPNSAPSRAVEVTERFDHDYPTSMLTATPPAATPTRRHGRALLRMVPQRGRAAAVRPDARPGRTRAARRHHRSTVTPTDGKIGGHQAFAEVQVSRRTPPAADHRRDRDERRRRRTTEGWSRTRRHRRPSPATSGVLVPTCPASEHITPDTKSKAPRSPAR